jgi:hypothetical protein
MKWQRHESYVFGGYTWLDMKLASQMHEVIRHNAIIHDAVNEGILEPFRSLCGTDPIRSADAESVLPMRGSRIVARIAP